MGGGFRLELNPSTVKDWAFFFFFANSLAILHVPNRRGLKGAF